jgi:methanogenic corrinoid protein MtbC1
LSTVVYRSRAVNPLSATELYDLAVAAQVRNRRASITGLVLYDNARFFQWLEGPAESVAQIMRDIRNDPRHTDVEVLEDHSSPARVFADWDMKLAARVPKAAAWQRDVLDPPIEIVEFLRQCPQSAPAALVKLNALSTAADSVVVDPMTQTPLNRTTAAILKDVLLSTVIPALTKQYVSKSKPANRRAPELADLLIASDETAAKQLIQELTAGKKSVFPLYGTLFEPAARCLGDLWNEDICSEFDVTLGLCRMQTAVRLLSTHVLGRSRRQAPPPTVLITPEPGEIHRLGSALDSEVLWNAGWVPRCEYPTDDRALQDTLAATWFDVLDLSLSPAFRRDHWLPRLTATITQARQASLNPSLLVLVGGRVFVEESLAGAQVGADMASTTALDVQQLITQGIREAV